MEIVIFYSMRCWSREGWGEEPRLCWRGKVDRGAIYNRCFDCIKNLLSDLPGLLESNFFVFNISLDCFCIATITIFQQLLGVSDAGSVKPHRLDRYWLKRIQRWNKACCSVFAGIYFVYISLLQKGSILKQGGILLENGWESLPCKI